jgi:hypothetical protein
VRPEVSLVRHAGSLVRVVRTVLATERTVRYSLLRITNKRYCFRKWRLSSKPTFLELYIVRKDTIRKLIAGKLSMANEINLQPTNFKWEKLAKTKNLLS